MAEFEWTACPSQIAHHTDKISAMKRKGKSPQFKEQRNYSAPKPSAANAPSRSSSKKQRRGGKKEKAQRAHAIVSSAFVPTSVLNCMQETHYMDAGPSSSRIKEVVEQIPAPTPSFTVAGGPSRALICTAAPVKIASFNSLGIPYSSAVRLPAQFISRSSSKLAPHNMDKERKLLKEVGIKPTIEPLKNATKALQAKESAKKQEEELDATMRKFLNNQKKWSKSAEASPAVQAAVALSSTVSEPPAK